MTDMIYGASMASHAACSPLAESAVPVGGDRDFWIAKRCYDVALSALGLVFVAAAACALLAANPFWNPGPVFFSQTRMGRNGRAFRVWKFRTMVPAPVAARAPGAPLEIDRITPLGGWLRRTRVDETPQFLNVLLGEMSLIGPRPDAIEHAQEFMRTVPGYRQRHLVRPGISGYAQVRMGYAEGPEMARRKAFKDRIYIRRAGWRLELLVFLRTIRVITSGFGAR